MLSRSSRVILKQMCCRMVAMNQRTMCVAVAPRGESQYANGKFRSNAQVQIDQQDVIYVDGYLAVCEGGGGSLGHPIEYITLDKVNESHEPSKCLYCGLKYKSKSNH